MAFITHRITIINTRKPIERNINEELQWLGTSLGLFNLRDKNKSCFRIFIHLLKNTRGNNSISSDELAEVLNLSRGTIIHHINHLIESGLVVNEANKYLLRVDNLHELIDEIEKDIKRTMDDLKRVASILDNKLKLV